MARSQPVTHLLWSNTAGLVLVALCLGGCQGSGAIAPFSSAPPLPSAVSVIEAKAISPDDLATQWVVSPAEAKWLIEQGATVLDARATRWRQQEMLQGAIAVNWQQFSQPHETEQGLLLRDDAELSQRLRAVGVWNDKPVVVVADPVRGWGEDGRIVWMLRTLGHSQAVLVDGGHDALVAIGLSVETSVMRGAPVPGDFVVRRTPVWEITRDELRHDLGNSQIVVIDVREEREFLGATPYGEARSGHLPGAIHLHYRELLDEKGTLLPRAEILRKLQERGVSSDAQMIAYCTAGVRAGWFTAVLTDVGLQVQNYAGSMLEWASLSPDDYPLVPGNQ